MLNVQLIQEYFKNKKVVHVLDDKEFPYHVRTIQENKPVGKFKTYDEAKAVRLADDSFDGMSNL
jgi:hypothetical protein